MPLDPQDRRLIEHLLGHVRAAARDAGARRGLPNGQQVLLSNGLHVTIALESGSHGGEGDPNETRLWLGVSRADRLPTFGEMQSLIALVFTASQRGGANPLAISTGRHLPNTVLCSSRLSRGESRPA